jgi:hypothetical protein
MWNWSNLHQVQKNFTLFEGTSEIQRMLIGRAVTGLDVRQPDLLLCGSVPMMRAALLGSWAARSRAPIVRNVPIISHRVRIAC